MQSFSASTVLSDPRPPPQIQPPPLFPLFSINKPTPSHLLARLLPFPPPPCQKRTSTEHDSFQNHYCRVRNYYLLRGSLPTSLTLTKLDHGICNAVAQACVSFSDKGSFCLLWSLALPNYFEKGPVLYFFTVNNHRTGANPVILGVPLSPGCHRSLSVDTLELRQIFPNRPQS